MVEEDLLFLFTHLGNKQVAGQVIRVLIQPMTLLILGALINVYRICAGLSSLATRISTLFPLTKWPVFGALKTAWELTRDTIPNVTWSGKPSPTAFATIPALGCRAVRTTRTLIV